MGWDARCTVSSKTFFCDKPKASATRNKYAKPASASPGGGGGGSDDDALQRVRGSKWHSFLPGMFR